MTDFVLVHGAWHGGWAWAEVADILRENGHRVFTPTLTGLGERAHLLTPDVGVELHAMDLRATIQCEELSDVVLVGHSYGSRPAALATVESSVRMWISLDGTSVRPGSTLFDGAPQSVIDATRAACVEAGAPAVAPFPAEVIGVPVEHPGHAWVSRRQTPMPWRCLIEPLPELPARFAQLSKAYVLAEQNNLAGPAIGATEAEEEGLYMIRIDSGHDLMVTAAEETAAALLALSNR